MIKVLKAGFYTTIQDRGRVGFAENGVPVSGVMDAYSANIANCVLNNSLDAAVLEITFGGVALQFLADTFISISGGDFTPKINNKSIQLNSRIQIFKNDVLSFGKINFGVRCYLSVKGGLLTKNVLNSRSFYQNVTSNFLIKKNDVLPISLSENKLTIANTSIKINKQHFISQELTCHKGPEFYLLNNFQQLQLLSQKFTISKENNRMGYRLNELLENKISSILTSSVLPGTVQLTPSGKLIILMKDCQVTGGYPRVLQLSKDATNRLSQKSTSQKVQFTL